MKKTILFSHFVLVLLFLGCSKGDDGSRLPGKWEVYNVTMGTPENPLKPSELEEMIGGTFHFHEDGNLETPDPGSNYQSPPRWEFLKETNAIRLSGVDETGDSVVKECKIEFVNDTLVKMYSPRFHPPYNYYMRKVD